MKKTITDKVRAIAKQLSSKGVEITAEAVGDKCGVQTFDQRKRIYNILYDLYRTGELERTGRGSYRYVGKPPARPQKQLIMWRFLRMQRTVTIEDLQEVAGVSADYALEWLGFLASRKLIRDHGNGKYQLVSDVLEMPRNDEKAAKLRELRRRKKAALEAMKDARKAIDKAEQALEQIVEEV